MKNKEHLIGNVMYIDTSMEVTKACEGCVFNDKSNNKGNDYFRCELVSKYTNAEYDSCPSRDGGQWVVKADNYEIY
jgi:hypothetical protein